MEKWKWNPYMNMTGKQDGLKQRGCLKTGKSLELQDIARGGNRGRMSGRGKREREVKTGRGIGQDKDVKTAGEDGPGRETKKGGKLNITRRSGRVRTLGTIPKAGSRPPETRDYRIYRLSAKEWVVYGCMGISACAVVAYTFYRSFMHWLPGISGKNIL